MTKVSVMGIGPSQSVGMSTQLASTQMLSQGLSVVTAAACPTANPATDDASSRAVIPATRSVRVRAFDFIFLHPSFSWKKGMSRKVGRSPSVYPMLSEMVVYSSLTVSNNFFTVAV